ncbi:MAG TPA: NUDIX domain-containing protein [Rhabdochlamydiaceae bacterium]|nr:NUDIX domain-containing protein [Rhabdochlamydiaceae bacterium]
MEKHFTATAYIVDQGKALLLMHPKLKKWLPPGGHVEINETPSECAKREALEETGLEIELIQQENLWLNFWNASSIERPYLCLLENIPAFGDKPAHQHIDMIYIARPLRGILLQGVRWFSLDEIETLIDDQEIFAETKTTLRHILTVNFLVPFSKS